MHAKDLLFVPAVLVALCLIGCGAGVSAYAPASLAAYTASETAWQTALGNCQTQPLNVVVLADSRSIADVTVLPGDVAALTDTFGSKWPDLLRADLNTRCGSHGSGLVPLRCCSGQPALNSDYYSQASWTTDSALGPYQGLNLPDSLTVVAPAGFSVTFDAHTAYDHIRTYCAAGPGLQPWTIAIDGARAGTCGGSAAAITATVAATAAVALSTHTATLACPQGPCEAYGLEAIAGTAGASVHNLGVGSCTAECFGLAPGTQLAFSDLIPGGQQLAVVSLITNERGVGYSTDSFRSALTALITHEQSASATQFVLVYAPLQDSIAGQAPYYPILRSIAGQQSTAYFDMRDTWGSSLVSSLFAPDGVHENNQGHAAVYAGISKALF